MTAQLFAPLAPEIEAALKASIQRFGVIVPVVEDQNGNVIDGRHRRRLAEELGVTCRVDQVQVADEAEALEVQRTLNADRRQMTTEQRREIELELRKEGHSQRAIAGALGVSRQAVRKGLVKAAGPQGPPQFPERSEGLDGKSYPATRPRASWMPLPTSKPMPPPRSRLGPALAQPGKGAGWLPRASRRPHRIGNRSRWSSAHPRGVLADLGW